MATEDSSTARAPWLDGMGFLVTAARYEHCRPAAYTWLGLLAALSAAILATGAMTLPAYLAHLVIGWVGWTFLEYHLHRYAMHWESENEDFLRMREELLPHINHHRNPENPRKVVKRSQVVPLSIAAIFLGLLWLAVPLPQAAAFTMGGGVGYLLYELTHFAIHQCDMTWRLPKRLKQHHLFHHYRDETVNFGVTTTVWDRVFGTLHRPARSRTRTASGSGR